MANLTGKGLAEFAISKKGTPYFYGAKFQDGPLTNAKMKQMHKLYPNIVTNSYINTAIKQGQVGKINADCSSLISGYTNKTYKANYKNFAIGTVLWRNGHVGVFCGKDSNGNYYCMEAKGIKYGCVKSILTNSSNWSYGLTFDFISYDYTVKVSGTSKTKNPYKVPTVVLKVNSSGESVKWLQFELREAGYDKSFTYNGKKYSAVVIDGKFGSTTKAAVMAFQQSSKIQVDGVVGKDTRTKLIAN